MLVSRKHGAIEMIRIAFMHPMMHATGIRMAKLSIVILDKATTAALVSLLLKNSN
jgi:hypothetical protein